MFKDGDNFRTSAGTQPRSWFSAAKGYTVKPGSTVWDNPNMNAHFAQLIRDGGPTWMWDVDGSGNLGMTHHRGEGATGNLMKLDPMRCTTSRSRPTTWPAARPGSTSTASWS
jgi:hypothetical protein